MHSCASLIIVFPHTPHAARLRPPSPADPRDPAGTQDQEENTTRRTAGTYPCPSRSDAPATAAPRATPPPPAVPMGRPCNTQSTRLWRRTDTRAAADCAQENNDID